MSAALTMPRPAPTLRETARAALTRLASVGLFALLTPGMTRLHKRAGGIALGGLAFLAPSKTRTILARIASIFVGPWTLMAAGSWTFTNNSRTYLLNGTFDLDTDSFLMALFLSTSNLGAATTTYAGVTNEHANANGYTTGGNATALSLSGTTTVTVDCTDEVWTASGGSITARFAAIYESGGNVLCYCLLDDTPADVTATDGNTLTVQIHASGVFTLA